MGKLRFTLTSLLFYIILFLSCFLAENFAFYTSNPLVGLNRSTSVLIAFLIIVLLLFYYYLEHRKNGLKFDKVLLPLLAICFLLMSITIIWQKNIGNVDKLITIAQIFIWMVVLYSILFTHNRFNAIKKVSTIFAIVFLVFILGCAFIDLFVEGKNFVAIFNGTYSESGFRFLIYHHNAWAMMLLFGQLTAYLLSIKKFNIFYYISSIILFLFIIMTTSTTAVFIGGASLILYTVYEVIYIFRSNRKKAIILFVSFFGSIALIALVSTILYQSKVVEFVNLFNYLLSRTFIKDYSNFSNRTFIWKEVFNMLLENPRNFIFGLGYRTADAMLETRVGVRTAHNGFIEVFLRHGLLGELVYLNAIGLFVFSIVKLFKKKQYRFAVISSFLFLAILIHGCTESTVIFAPNSEGCYLLIAFYLPVVNVLKEKKFDVLKEQVDKQEVVPIDKANISLNVFSLALGLVASLFIASFLNALNNQNVRMVFLIVASSLLALVLIASLILSVTVFKGHILKVLETSFVPLLITIILGLSFVYFLNYHINPNVFGSVIVFIIIFVLYFASYFFIPNKNKKDFVDYCDRQYLRMVSRIQ